MTRRLTITVKPFKSSKLAIPPSPSSPRLPLTPPASPRKDNSIRERTQPLRRAEFPPPPTEPLQWLWQCHLCNRTYQLGVTRRCLDDGHYFCSGSTVVKRSKKSGKSRVIRHKACPSEFDYAAWKAWGEWRRAVFAQAEAAAMLDELLSGSGLLLFNEGLSLNSMWTAKHSAKSPAKDCWNTCDYPSECRWGKLHSVQNAVPSLPVLSSAVFKPTLEPKKD